MKSRSLFARAALLVLLVASPLRANDAAAPPAKLAPDAGVSLSPELLRVPLPPPPSLPAGTAPALTPGAPVAAKAKSGTPAPRVAVEGQRGQPDVSSPAFAAGDRDRALYVRVEFPF